MQHIHVFWFLMICVYNWYISVNLIHVPTHMCLSTCFPQRLARTWEHQESRLIHWCQRSTRPEQQSWSPVAALLRSCWLVTIHGDVYQSMSYSYGPLFLMNQPWPRDMMKYADLCCHASWEAGNTICHRKNRLPAKIWFFGDSFCVDEGISWHFTWGTKGT